MNPATFGASIPRLPIGAKPASRPSKLRRRRLLRRRTNGPTLSFPAAVSSILAASKMLPTNFWLDRFERHGLWPGRKLSVCAGSKSHALANLFLSLLCQRVKRKTQPNFYRIHNRTAIVTAAMRSVPIRYRFKCSQFSRGIVMEERNAALTPPDGWEDSQSRHSLRPADTGNPQLSQLPIFPRSEGTTIGDPSDLCSSVWSSAGVCSLLPFEVLGLSASDFRTVSPTTGATRVSAARADAR